MPSTYSALKFQLMATGENTTTWGDVTNLNLEAVDQAIAQSSDVSFSSANVTISLSDTNNSQAARNLRLRCTGTTGGSARNLVVPDIEKPYIVQNDCADAITVKTSAGTGITVPAGKTIWVYADGTNVVDAVTHLSSVTLATNITTGLGAVGTPSYTFTGDLNTGMWSPAADTVAFSTAGSERLRIDSAGDVGIGIGTPGRKLDIVAGPDTGNQLNGIRLHLSGSTTARAEFLLGTEALGAPFTSVRTGNDTNGYMNFFTGTGPAERMRITSAGDVGIGNTPSGTYKLEVTGAAYASSMVLGAALPIASGGTGGTDAAGARTALAAAASGANTDITALDQDVTVTATGTIAANSLGFRGIPQNARTGAYTLTLDDAGKHISNTTGGFAIPANGTTAFPIGTTVVLFNNSASSQNITITTDTLRFAGTSLTGTRTLDGYGLATCVKVATTVWVISGAGVG
jgi:hypothetical protein